ncbi:MAG: hypothetical protein IH994_08645 [Proteobacteria bacterium]|nr:hypothetical protein [Pseudomonadota bacterium]
MAVGVFGAPSYVLDEELFWGQDRLDFLDRVLANFYFSDFWRIDAKPGLILIPAFRP